MWANPQIAKFQEKINYRNRRIRSDTKSLCACHAGPWPWHLRHRESQCLHRQAATQLENAHCDGQAAADFADIDYRLSKCPIIESGPGGRYGRPGPRTASGIYCDSDREPGPVGPAPDSARLTKLRQRGQRPAAWAQAIDYAVPA